MGLHHGQANFVTYGKPSLFLDFANKKSLVDRISGNNLITFTRSSTGTYVGDDGLIKTAVADEARFDHDPETGESLGLLIEESRTNFQDYSVDINTGIEFLTGSTLTSNAAAAPDGTITATRITGSGIDEATRLGWNTQATSSSQYNVFSVFVKADSGTPILGFYSNTFVAGLVVFNIDLSDGSTNTINNPGSFYSKVVAYPNGWYRVTVMGGPGTGVSGSWNINLVPSLTSARTASSGSNSSASYLIWGVQEELGTALFPTSYIPTSGSTVTRQVDYPRITGTNFSSWFNNSQGSVITDMSGTKSSFGGNFGISFGSSGTNYIAYPYIQSNGTITNTVFFVIENGTYIDLPNGSVPYTYGFSYGSGSTPLYGAYDGISQPPDPNNNSYISTDFDSLRIGLSHFAPGEHQNFHLKKLIYYPQQFITSQLQSLTQ